MSYSFFVVALGIYFLNDETLSVCNPPLAYPEFVTELWNYGSIAISLMSMAAFLTTYYILYKLASRKSLNSAARYEIPLQKMQIQNLAINAFLYFMSSVLCDFLIRAMRAADISLRVVSDTESYAVIPGLISYSANYYVYFWRSREHRRAFQNQLKCGFALKRSGKLFIVTRSSMANIKRADGIDEVVVDVQDDVHDVGELRESLGTIRSKQSH
ncbi:hypothetical protein L596_019378 [Steinernema carpocapsae]|uniref:G protein-coupled receptor n=1 Tax=Steinernema carpocapsae TaxID=34508 RepID=A0A4V6A0J9_STECR|nr:hypothetical protein L596_019378 [Steinernema carpocapsae]